MGRIKTIVSKEDLLNTIKKLESNQTFENISKLSEAVSKTEWAVDNGVTASVCTLRLKEFNLLDKINTKAGRRGRQPGQTLSQEHKDKLLAGRERSIDEKYLKRMLKIVPERFHGTVKKAAKGNKTAVLKLKCLDCSDYQTKEIKECSVCDCPLYHIRPYK